MDTIIKKENIKDYFNKDDTKIILDILKKERISSLDRKKLEKIGFKYKTVYCKNNYLKDIYLYKSKDLFLLESRRTQKKYFCIGLCQKNKWNACWMQYQLPDKK